MATRVPGLIQLSDPRVAAHLVYSNDNRPTSQNDIPGIIITDVAGYILSANDSSERVFLPSLSSRFVRFIYINLESAKSIIKEF